MLSPATHRRWAREFLARAQEAPNRNRRAKYLKLAVRHSVRARNLEGVERRRAGRARRRPRPQGKTTMPSASRFCLLERGDHIATVRACDCPTDADALLEADAVLQAS